MKYVESEEGKEEGSAEASYKRMKAIMTSPLLAPLFAVGSFQRNEKKWLILFLVLCHFSETDVHDVLDF